MHLRRMDRFWTLRLPVYSLDWVWIHNGPPLGREAVAGVCSCHHGSNKWESNLEF